MNKNETVAEIALTRDNVKDAGRPLFTRAFSAWGKGWVWSLSWVLTCAFMAVTWGCASGTSGQDDDGGVGIDASVQQDAESPEDSSVDVDGEVDGEVLPDSTVEADAEPEQDAEVEIDAELPPACDDGLMNGDETDVDCGGPDCDPCPDGDGCIDGTDCESGFCNGGICQSPACNDNVLNGDETDVDCGGGTCPGCAAGLNCDFGSDCLSGDCSGGVCQQGDVDPPTILSITPFDGATGVEKDTNIVIQFSEPMDEVNTEAAYSSTDLPPSSVTFSWNLSSDTLTIAPINDLSYASGSDPNTVPALEYAFVITTQARDVAGNTLTVARNSSFYTLREITQTLSSVSSLTGDVRDDGTTNGCSSTSVCAGDSGITTDAQYKGFASFDISSVPTPVFEFIAATLSADQDTTFGAPYTGLGNLNLHHIVYSSLSPTAFNATPLHDLGVFSSDTTLETKSLDVTVAVTADLVANRTNSGYRFEFDSATDFDGSFDAALFDTTTLTLQLIYLVE